VAVVANCGLLKNDGSSFFLLNAGGVLLLNDTSCGTEAGVSESVLGATGVGSGSFEGYPPPEAAATPPGGVGWADQLSARERQARWDADNKRMELLQRKKTRISLDIGELRFELKDESHPGRIKKLQGKLNTAMDALMAIEDELQELYVRMLQ
jgi:hypothetical protein